MDNYRARGHVLCFDYFHSTYNPMAVGEAKKAAGQFEPEIRPDGLWYTRIQWTPKAAQAIRDGEWPFISPAVIHDKDGVISGHLAGAVVFDWFKCGMKLKMAEQISDVDSVADTFMKLLGCAVIQEQRLMFFSE
jgi:phage I-like protein